jgi:hypothetical protein
MYLLESAKKIWPDHDHIATWLDSTMGRMLLWSLKACGHSSIPLGYSVHRARCANGGTDNLEICPFAVLCTWSVT